MRKEIYKRLFKQLSFIFGSVDRHVSVPTVLTTVSLMVCSSLFLKPLVLSAKANPPVCSNAGSTRIGNRNYGITSCVMSRPPVERQETFVREFGVLSDNMLVQVDAGGCVQTGGSGKTWKRYVDPYPDPNFYYGTISIPRATNGFIPIRNAMRDAKGNPIFWRVGARGPFVNQPGKPFNYLGAVIGLGYIDGNYGDNGYSDHDDGNGNQCRNSTDAWVRLIIYNPSYP